MDARFPSTFYLPSFIQIGDKSEDNSDGYFIVFEDEEESMQKELELIDGVDLEYDPQEVPSDECTFWPLCYPKHLFKCSKWVGYISLLSVFANLLFVVFGNSQTVFHTLIELLLLLLELLSILALFHGIAHQSPNYLRPFLLFGLLWNSALFVLWLFCFIEMLQQKQEFLQEIVENASIFINIDQQANIHETGNWLTIVLLFGLGLVIVIGLWFLNIVALTYIYLKRCQQQWDASQIEAEKSLLAPHKNAIF